jgi:hypothetical protein
VVFNVVLKRLERVGKSELAKSIDKWILWGYPVVYIGGGIRPHHRFAPAGYDFFDLVSDQANRKGDPPAFHQLHPRRPNEIYRQDFLPEGVTISRSGMSIR